MKTNSILSVVARLALICISPALIAQGNSSEKPAAQNIIQMKASPATSVSTDDTVTITMPAGTQYSTLKAKLNGHDVSSRFSLLDCKTVCETATLTANDGLSAVKNVLAVEVNGNDGSPITSRLRFAATSASTGSSRLRPALAGQNTLRPQAQALSEFLPTASNFLPPTISLQTNYTGGPNSAAPWIQLGSQQQGQLPSSYVGCSGSPNYFVIDLDRQSLEERTPTSAGQCINDGATLASYLSSLQQGDLVIMGTWVYHNADSQLNTTAIGGTDYTTSARQSSGATSWYPRGYVAIGVVGAAPGEAYENFYTDDSNSNSEDAIPFAMGMLVEDPNGNYNFQPTNGGANEYIVVPSDPSVPSSPTAYKRATIRISKVNPDGSKNFNVYYSNNDSTDQALTFGVWMMVFNRNNMTPYDPSGSCKAGAAYSPLNPGDTAYIGCGTFYQIGDNPEIEWARLANDLNAVPQHKLVMLTTVQCCGYTDSFTSATTLLPQAIGPALSAYGAPSYALQTANGNFSLVSSRDTTILNSIGVPIQGADLDFTSTLNGNAVFSIANYSTQGQTGYLRGVLVPDHYGLYAPTISNQESSTISATASSMDLGLHEIYYSTPQDWPELTTLLPGASTVAGQQAAYLYLSYDLLINHYMAGVTGGNEDDIHYYFTGGLNTLINYYNYNPTSEQWPGGNNTSFSWTDPVLSAPNNTVSFTQADFNAVRAQLSQEVQYLTNTLTMMVTGSTNLKDIVAGGQNSVATAMIGAASTIYNGTLSPPATTKASANVSNILNFVGAVVSIGVEVATDGLVPQELESDVEKWGGIISGGLWAAGSVGFVNPGSGNSNSSIPNPTEKFLSNIGDLASAQLQGQMGQNFDAMLDMVLSDWGKLSFVAPKVMDTSATGWYLPRQSVQSAVIDVMNKASQRSIYLSLLPSFYYLDAWYGNYPWVGAGATDLGYQMGGESFNEDDCGHIYSDSIPPFAAMSYFTNGGISLGPIPPNNQPASADNQQADLFVIGGTVKGAGASYSETLAPASVPQYLFGTLNLPVPSFFDLNGPLPLRPGPGFTGFGWFCGKHSQILTDYSSGLPPTAGLSAGQSSKPLGTSVVLTGPASSAVGTTITLVAKATNASGVIPGKSIVFLDENVEIGMVKTDGNGSASLQLTGLGGGVHHFTAGFIASGALLPSVSTTLTHTVYAHPADMTVQLSANTLSVSYSGQSSPVTLQVQSLYGMSGTVTFSCSGLPVGMTCNFNPASATLAGSSNASTSFTIVPTSTSKASAGGSHPASGRGLRTLPLLSSGNLALLLLPLALGRTRRAIKNARLFLGALVLVAGTFMIGCGGSTQSGTPQPTPNQGIQESGAKTLLVSATIGNTTRTVPLVVNIQ